MAFSNQYLARNSSSGNIDVAKAWIYNGTAATGSNDSLATIVASGYFNDAQSTLTAYFPAGYTGTQGQLAVGDIISIRGNDQNGQYYVTSITTNVTLAVWQSTSGVTYSGSAAVIGDLPAFGNTSGDIVDSGVLASDVAAAITQLGALNQIAVTLTPADVIAAYATPQVLIPAVAGQVAIVHSATVYTASTGNTPFATGAGPIIQYGTTVHGAGTNAVGSGLVTGDIEASTSQVRTLGAAASAALTGVTDTAVCFSASTAYTAGTGTNVTFTLVYEMITATV